MEEIIMMGYGEHGRVIYDILKEDQSAKWIGYIDQVQSTKDLKSTWLGQDKDLEKIASKYPQAKYLIGVGNPKVRRKLINTCRALDLKFATVISKSAVISPTAAVGAGTVVMRGAIVNSEAVVKEHCIINTGAIVEHECHLGENVQIAPGACMGGNVHLEEDAFVGLNATLLLGIKVGTGAVVGAGAVVTAHVSEGDTVVGVPAKSIK